MFSLVTVWGNCLCTLKDQAVDLYPSTTKLSPKVELKAAKPRESQPQGFSAQGLPTLAVSKGSGKNNKTGPEGYMYICNVYQTLSKP